MGIVEQSIVVALDFDEARDEWQEFSFQDDVGRGGALQGQVAIREADLASSEERVSFEEVDSSSTRVTLKAEFEEDDDVDIASLRADVNDELARYREFVERRAA